MIDRLKDTKTINQEFCDDVDAGLSKQQKTLPCKYFYDDKGSRIFQEIMAMPEYYPTDSELEILKTYKTELGNLFNSQTFNLIELGAGDGLKTKVLLQDFLKRSLKFSYVPIDISKGAIEELAESLQGEMPDLKVRGIVGDYYGGIEQMRENKKRNVVLFLGSSIGNFNLEQSREFLTKLRDVLSENDLVLIGFDLQKDQDTLLNAYSDPHGITASFNLNLLHRMNKELDADIDLDSFRHEAAYDQEDGCMKSFLVSNKDQTVSIKAIGKSYEFKANERIHTEDSRKYTTEIITQLAKDTGFVVEKNFTDSKNYYIDSLWRPI